MDVAEIIQQAQRRAGRVDPNFDARCLEFLDEAIEQWSLVQPWSTLRQTATLVSPGGRSLVVPNYFRQVTWVADDSNNRYLAATDFWERREPSQFLGDTVAAPYWWRETGTTPVFTQPSTPAQISFRTATSDAFSVYIQGVTRDTTMSGTAGYEFIRDEIVSIQGSGPATTGSYYVKILTVGKNARSVDDLQILNSTTEIGRIPSRLKRADYRELELHPIPSAGQIFRVGGLTAPGRITRSTEVPHPSINPQYLVWYVAYLIHTAQQNFDKANFCEAKANEILLKRSYQERMGAERDLGMLPDENYWNFDQNRSWP